MNFLFSKDLRAHEARVVLSLDKTLIITSPSKASTLPSVYDGVNGFKATKQIFSYFFHVAQVETLDRHFIIEASPELSEEQQRRAVACAVAAGAKSAEYKPSQLVSVPDVVVTDLDYERLSEIIRRARSEESTFLAEELARAKIVPQKKVSPDIITMNSSVLYFDHESKTEREVKLVYPQDANIEHSRISILAPVGSALLGLKPGSEIQWALPRRSMKRIRVLAVPYQPEAAGDWHL
ncbi:MAG: nucleoside diphosphate kinase regulator [Proteobacteria bacterium]|nr:MAG: nucleoside diphosphate kinase regulator [Pseudomonadota bacterium]